MSDTPSLETTSQRNSPPPPAAPSVDGRVGHAAGRTGDHDGGQPAGAALAGQPPEARLVQVRLGIASSLFAALQCKHAATAGHASRVALTCSAWAGKLGMPTPQRDLLEIAALLHDMGVIGVPDQVLLKPGVLDSDEAAVMRRSRGDGAGDPPPQLQLAGDAADRGERPRLVRRRPREPTLPGQEIPLARPHDRHRRGLRRHDHRPRLPARPVAGAGDGGVVPVRRGRSSTRSWCGSSPSSASRTMGTLHREVAGRWLRSLDPRAGQFLLGAQLRALAGGAAGGDALVPGQAAGQHVRRGGVRRRRAAGSRCGTTGRSGSPASPAAASASSRWTPEVLRHGRREGQAGRAPADCPVARRVRSRACNRCGG